MMRSKKKMYGKQLKIVPTPENLVGMHAHHTITSPDSVYSSETTCSEIIFAVQDPVNETVLIRWRAKDPDRVWTTVWNPNHETEPIFNRDSEELIFWEHPKK